MSLEIEMAESIISTAGGADDEVILSVKNVSKKFCRNLKRALSYAVADIGSEVLGLRSGKARKLRKDEFWALSDINFELRRGDAVGLVGANGAGKTTLLKVISGLIKPDKGSVHVRGRIAPLIALGAGFNPILTGRENIYVNMSILGLTRRQIDERFNEVVEFAEIGHAIDSPVQSYSSGMSARLGFACAVHTDPDILLVDEVLAVGDVKFRMKCYRKLEEFKEKGVSFILVSHSSQSVTSVCKTAIYLQKGQVVAVDDVDVIMSRYESDLFDGHVTLPDRYVVNTPDKVADTTGLSMLDVFFRTNTHDTTLNITTGESCTLCIVVKAWRRLENIGLNVIVRGNQEKENLFQIDSSRDNNLFSVEEGINEIHIDIPYCTLVSGIYSAKININTGSINIFDGVEAVKFKVSSKSHHTSIFYQPYGISVAATQSEKVNE